MNIIICITELIDNEGSATLISKGTHNINNNGNINNPINVGTVNTGSGSGTREPVDVHDKPVVITDSIDTDAGPGTSTIDGEYIEHSNTNQ